MVALVTMKVGEMLYSFSQTLLSRRRTNAVWHPKAPLIQGIDTDLISMCYILQASDVHTHTHIYIAGALRCIGQLRKNNLCLNCLKFILSKEG